MQQQKNKKQNRNLFGGKIDVIFELFFPYTLLPHTQRERESDVIMFQGALTEEVDASEIFLKNVLFFFFIFFFLEG